MFIPHLLRLDYGYLLTQLRHRVLVQKLHDLLLHGLARPVATGVLDRRLGRLENGIADVLEPLPFVRLDVLELLLDHVVAVEEVAQVDAAALAEAVGVVGL
jgi:hypothetical protein